MIRSDWICSDGLDLALVDHLTAHGLVLEMLAGPPPGLYDPAGEAAVRVLRGDGGDRAGEHPQVDAARARHRRPQRHARRPVSRPCPASPRRRPSRRPESYRRVTCSLVSGPGLRGLFKAAGDGWKSGRAHRAARVCRSGRFGRARPSLSDHRPAYWAPSKIWPEADSVKSDIFRISASLAAATLTVLASTACGTGKPVATPESVTHSELAGRWDGGRECRSPLPVIRLRDDYTFSVKDFPVEWSGPGPDSQVTRRSTPPRPASSRKLKALQHEPEGALLRFWGIDPWVRGQLMGRLCAGPVELVGEEWLQHAVLVLADFDSG
jgi:hypothetical protein